MSFPFIVGHVEAVEVLLLNVKDPELRKALLNRKCKKGETPVFKACSNGHTKVVEVMVDLAVDEIDWNAMDNKGQNALHHACEGGKKF